ncbi:hypothetical protein [Synoicihabitans lomoniglobus]|uniref:Methyltransferase domain-containing protein n=1 Tax=Synoicihabitans lomoniglobus TaxID=2909285 RepID=A0AAF0CHM1_9BACT|nr:hypothetical protein [Opitutaceae bacterium LMO-M01]WED64472.1 hypothetical protein PXH66_19200 [Opitutaceae bacterium LMO-M01]
MDRTVTPELLDSLSPDSPAARHSRRDLVWFNRLLGNNRWWRKTLPRLLLDTTPNRALEIGAGDGALARAHRLDALDQCPAPSGWPADQTWHQHDVLRYDRWVDYDLIAANFFLHHFTAPQLAQLGAIWNHTARVIVACEPWRAPGFRSGFALLCAAMRAHAVSRHDGRVSICAGFRQTELPGFLGLDSQIWQWEIVHHPLGTYRFIARKSRSTP